jgi:hypothetical protein
MNNVSAFETSTLQELSNGVLGTQFCVFFALPTKALNIRNSCMNAIPKVGMHLEVVRLYHLHSPSFVKVCFTPKHIPALMGPWTSFLVKNPMLKLWQVRNILYCITNPFTSFTKIRNTCISISPTRTSRPSFKYSLIQNLKSKISWMSYGVNVWFWENMNVFIKFAMT